MNQQLCYHESLQHLHVNTLPNHAYFIPHASRETALTGDRTQSGRLTLLNGQWCFRYFDKIGMPFFLLHNNVGHNFIQLFFNVFNFGVNENMKVAGVLLSVAGAMLMITVYTYLIQIPVNNIRSKILNYCNVRWFSHVKMEQ